ncbi:hypothetical protein VPH35_078055 [Triticum aestivum]
MVWAGLFPPRLSFVYLFSITLRSLFLLPHPDLIPSPQRSPLPLHGEPPLFPASCAAQTLSDLHGGAPSVLCCTNTSEIWVDRTQVISSSTAAPGASCVLRGIYFGSGRGAGTVHRIGR